MRVPGPCSRLLDNALLAEKSSGSPCGFPRPGSCLQSAAVAARAFSSIDSVCVVVTVVACSRGRPAASRFAALEQDAIQVVSRRRWRRGVDRRRRAARHGQRQQHAKQSERAGGA